MATKSFLTKQEWEQAKSLLPKKKFSDFEQNNYQDLSQWLSDTLIEKFESLPGWKESRPFAIGSWGRGELTPLSDVDILFAGPQDIVLKVMQEITQMGLHVLARQPHNVDDWTQAADEFDLLSYLTGKSIYPEHEALLQEQRLKILNDKSLIDKIRDRLLENKKQRDERYDSISNYLEPHLKNVPGGYRDLYQAQVMAQLYFAKDKRFAEFIEQIDMYKTFFLRLRQVCQLLGGGDILNASTQQDVKEFLGYQSVPEMMHPIQLALFQGNFLHDFFAEASKLSAGDLDKAFEIKSASTTQIGRSLLDNPGAVNTKVAETLCVNGGFVLGKKDFNSLLDILTPNLTEPQLRALFRSGWLQVFLPELKSLRGLVQHDQYHRYTVAAHLFVAMREVLRGMNDASRLRDMSNIAQDLKAQDWQILFYTALFHDIAKGSGQDHSLAGELMVVKYLSLWGESEDVVNSVAWLVKNHLVLSNAAFRRNPGSVETWKQLIQKGVYGHKAKLLVVFTVIDILATNPDAWNNWKSKLLFDLHQKLEQFDQGYEVLDDNLIEGLDLLKDLDSGVIEAIPLSVLINDLNYVKTVLTADPLLIKTEQGFWVRFYQRQDMQGVFLRLTQLLYQLGCSIQQSFVHTLKDIGVYDWFLVKEPRDIERFKKQLKIVQPVPIQVPEIKFEKILIVEENSEETLFSFRGKDQKGALICALQSIYDEGLTVLWARVHTWGQQIDDTICVSRPKDSEKVLKKLIERLVHTQN